MPCPMYARTNPLPRRYIQCGLQVALVRITAGGGGIVVLNAELRRR